MELLAVGLKFLGLLGGRSANKAALAIQEAEFALKMAEGADQEKLARRQVKSATDKANLILAESNLSDKYEAALQGLADKGIEGSQRIVDDFARTRHEVGREYLGGGGDTRREEKLKLLRDAREKGMLDAVGDEASIGGQFSGAGVRGMPAQWAEAYNKSAKNIYGEMENVAGLTADLTSPQDANLMTAMGGTKLQAADLSEKAMTKALGEDIDIARGDIEKEGRDIAAAFGQKRHDVDFGYTLPTTIMEGVPAELGKRYQKAKGKQEMFSGLGSIAQSFV